MRLVSFKSSGVVRIGAVVDDKVVHLNALLSGSERVPDDMTAFLMAGEPAMAAAHKAVEAFKRGEGSDAVVYIGRKNTYYTFFLLRIALYALAPTAAAMGSKMLFIACFCIILSM
jgi:hypothetical protein